MVVYVTVSEDNVRLLVSCLPSACWITFEFELNPLAPESYVVFVEVLDFDVHFFFFPSFFFSCKHFFKELELSVSLNQFNLYIGNRVSILLDESCLSPINNFSDTRKNYKKTE